MSTLPRTDSKMLDKVPFDYSPKDIPTANRTTYLKCLVDKTEQFLRRLRWRAFFFLNPKASSETKETYGFNSRKTPPIVEELKEFENCMIDLAQSIEFKTRKNTFQQKLKMDIKSLKEDDKLIVKADKTVNYYKVDCGKYNELLHSNITQSYKKNE